MATGVLVYVENRGGKIRKAALEALTVGRMVAEAAGSPLFAFLAGGADLVETVKQYGPARIYHDAVDSPAESRDVEIILLEKAIRAADPALVVAGATSRGKDMLPGVAARFGRAVIMDATEVRPDGAFLSVKRPIYAGKAYETLNVAALPAFLTIRPNVFAAAEKPNPGAEVVPAVEKFSLDQLRTIVKEIRESGGAKMELTEAPIVVSGGRGIKGPEHYRLVEELAEVLGAAAGASRAVVDAGWIDHHHQVGQTGKTVTPQLYVALGISGAIQHLAGMSSSKYIVAINKDAEAPIFKVANYGIVGDLFKVVPLLVEELKKSLG